MSENFVRIAKKMCPVCGKEHESNEILLNLRLRDIPDEAVLNGYEMCEEHKKLCNDGYIALVEVDPERSAKTNNPKMEDVYRTGRLMHIRRTVAERIFTGIDLSSPMMWIDPATWDKLERTCQL